MKKLMNKIKHLNKKLVLICTTIFASLATIVAAYAWFTGNIEKNGITIKTGEILVDAKGYNYDATNKSLDLLTDDIGYNSALITTDLFQYGQTNDTYFMVELQPGSIDIDYYLTIKLENSDYDLPSEEITEDELTYIGGYWFKLEKVTTQALSATNILDSSWDTTDMSAHEITLMNYAETVRTTSNTGTEHPLSLIEKYPTRDTLTSLSSVQYYRLTCGFTNYSQVYTNTTIRLRARLDYAQKGALTEAERQESCTWYVNTVEDLYEFLAGYAAGDILKIQGDIVYSGDLEIRKPLNIYVVNSTFRILGNLIFDFPYSEEYFINTATNGKIVVSSGSGTGSAGNFELRTPNSECHLVGKGKVSGTGDMYVRGNIYVNVGYGGEDISGGLYISGFNAYDTTFDGNIPTSNLVKKDYYFEGESKIELSSNSSINEIVARVSESETSETAKIIKIVNYGEIKKIRLTSMTIDSNIVDIPQIYIDNYGEYGTETDYQIELPQLSMPFLPVGSGGNTRIIQEESSNTLKVKLATESSANTNPFRDHHIEIKYVTQFVVDNNPSSPNTDLTIHYADNQDGTSNTIETILKKYYFPAADQNDTGLNAQLNTILANVQSLKIISYQRKELTAADMTIVKKCTNLQSLDTSKAYYLTLHANGLNFNDFAYLTNIVLSENLLTLGSSIIFKGCTILEEIRIPASVSSINVSFFTYSGIKYVHLENAETIYTSGLYTNSILYFFVNEELLNAYRTYTSYTSVPYNFLPEATWNFDHSFFYNQLPNGLYELVLETGSLQTDGSGVTLIDSLEITAMNYVSIYSIGDYAFYNYDYQSHGNTNIVFGDSVAYIGNMNFYNKGTFTSINLNNIKEVGSNCFNSCIIQNIDARNVEIAYLNAFRETTLDVINFDSLEVAHSNCFYGSTLPATCSFPSLIDAKEYAFCYTYNVKKLVCENLIYGGYCTFAYSRDAETYYFPKLSIYGPGNNAGYLNTIGYCNKLYELYIGVPSSWWRYDPIRQCKKLRYVYICGTTYDDTLTGTIGYPYAEGCDNLRVVIYNKNLESYVTSNFINNAGCNKCPIDGDAKDLVFYDTYRGDSNEFSLNHGKYILDINGSNVGIVAYEPSNINSTTEGGNSYTIPGSVTIGATTYTVTKIFNYAYNFTKITINNFTISNSITSVGYCAFDANSYSKTINTSFTADGLQRTDGYSFRKVNFPSNVSFPALTYLSYRVFDNCDTLVYLSLENVTEVGSYCFDSLDKIETIYMPNCHYFPRNGNNNFAFYNCPNLYELYIGVPYRMGMRTILYCTNFTYLYVCGTSYDQNLLESYQDIFYENPGNLHQTIIHKDVATFFNTYYCPSYTAYLSIISTDPKYIVKSGDYYGKNGDLTLNHGLYVVEPLTSSTATLVGYAPNSIGSSTTPLNSYTVPGSLTCDNGNTYNIVKVDDYAYCKTTIYVENLVISSPITELGKYTFYCGNSKNLGSITAPSLQKAGIYCFYACKINSLNSPNFTYAGSYCFNKCIFPETMSIPSLTYAGSYAFQNCDTVYRLELDNLETIGYQTFDNMDLLEILYIPNHHYFSTSSGFTIAHCPNLVELYVGITYEYYRLNICQCYKLTYIYICGTTFDTSLKQYTNGSYYFYDGSSPTYTICNSAFETYIRSYLYSATTILPLSGDAKDLLYYDDFYGSSNQFHSNLGRYILEEKTDSTLSIVLNRSKPITIDNYSNDKYTIPGTATIDSTQYTISEIGFKAYYWTTMDIGELNIPNTITTIDDYSFAKTSSYAKTFDKITANGLITVGEYGFSEGTIGEFDAPNLKTALNYGFFKTTFEDEAIFPRLQSAGISCFETVSFLDDVTFSSLITASNRCFYGCRFGGDVTFSALKTAGNECFRNSGLPTYTSVPNLETAGDDCFVSCNNVVELTLESLTYLGYHGLASNSLIEKFYAPSLSYYKCKSGSYNEIFYSNPKLFEIYIGVVYEYNGLDFIAGNNLLKYIYICDTTYDLSKQGTATSRKDYFIRNSGSIVVCTSDVYNHLTAFYCYSSYNGWQIIDFNPIDIFTMKKDNITYKCYIDSDNDLSLFKCYDTQIGTGANGEVLDLSLSYTDSSSITHNISSIYKEAFKYTSIKTPTINIPRTVETIGENAFVNSGNTFTTINHLGSGTIKNSAFKSNTRLNTLNLIGSVDTIEADAFYGISNATIKLGNTTTVIAENNIFNTGSNNSLSVYGLLLPQYVALGTWNGIPSSRMSSYTGKYIESGTNNTFLYDIIGSTTNIRIINVAGTSSDGTLTIPSTIPFESETYTVTQVMSYALSDYNNLITLVLPSTLTEFNFVSSDMPNTLQAYSIDTSNSVYSTDNGVLYSKDKKVLISYPKGKTGTSYTVDSATEIIASHAFDGARFIETIVVPSKVYVLDYAFANLQTVNTVTVSFTSTSSISIFVGNNIFDNVSSYIIDVDDSFINNYKLNVLVDTDITTHIQ